MRQRHLLKFISLIVALIIWTYVLSTAHIQIEKSVPVKYELPEGMALASPIQKEVTYVLDTPKAFIKSLLDRKDEIEVDLRQLKSRKKNADKYVVDFQTNDIKLPIGVSVLQIIPKRTYISLDVKVSKKVPIKADFINKVPDQKNLSNFQFRPEEVEVRGPRSLLRHLKTISTYPIDLSNLDSSGQKAVALKIDDERFSLSHQELLFIYDIKTTQSNIKLEHVPIMFQSARLIKKASQRKVTLYLLSEKNDLTVAQKEQLAVIAAVQGKEKEQSVKLRVQLPEGLELLKISPESVVVYTE